MPWNPLQGFESWLTDANGAQTQALVRGQSFSYTSEKDPADPRPFEFVMINEANYAKNPPLLDDFIMILPCEVNDAGTELICRFEVPADLDDQEVLLGFARKDSRDVEEKGYGGDKYPVRP